MLEYGQFLLVLGVESILPITMPFHAKPGCPKHLVDIYERAVNAQPASYLLPPVTGEVFASIAACEARLRGFALAEGFDIVQTGGGNKRVPSARWLRSQHDVETRNWRKLEDRVEYDEEGAITTKRQREGTSVGQLACDWAVRVSWKDVGRRGSGTKAFVMSANCLEHSHKLTINPLSFPRHRQALVRTARKHRIAVISYSASRRVLEAEELGLVLTSREYYNSLRKLIPDKAKPETIDALLVELHEAGFVYRTRVQEDVDDEDNMVERKMIQLWFAYREQLNIAARFCADFLIVVDSTFNTNRDRLPLLIAVGVLNSGRTFPVCFSYCPSESEDSFKFVWDSLNEECFIS